MHPNVPTGSDQLAVSLRRIAQYLLTIIFGLTPLLFVPNAVVSFGYSKSIVILAGVLLALIFFSLSVLRSGELHVGAPRALTAFWVVAGIALLSALFSGDMSDSLYGDRFATHSALFVVFMALIASLCGIFVGAKSELMRLYMILAGSTIVLGLFHILRVVFGADFLSFGIFTTTTSSPVGAWNDLAIFFGLSILLSIVALEQLPLPKLGQWLFSGVVAVALVMLAIINFFIIWIVLGAASLIVLMYALTKDRFRPQSDLMPQITREGTSITAISVVAVVFVVSVLFVIGGSALGNIVSKHTNISHVEVRPSLQATIDIARGEFGENAFLGIGPNKFSDAWRLYKNPAINSTIFWSTPFRAGNGYITSFLITTGILGALAWLVFFGFFILSGIRMLFRTKQVDKFWYFIGSSSFVAALFIWCMSVLYVPGSTILILGAVFTGLSFVSYAALLPEKARVITMSTDRRAGFVLVAVVMVVIVSSVSALYLASRHYYALYTFNQAIASIESGTTLQSVEKSISDAFALNGSDVFARQLATYQLARMNTLLSVTNPTEAQQQQFQDAIANGIRSAQTAVDLDPTDAENWAVLGSIYSVLTIANIEGSADRAREAIGRARELDPSNPEYLLIEAQIDSRTGDLDAAREKTTAAIRLKPNYTDALLFSTQLDIATGNTVSAIETTKAIIALEPQNPARYYQLGVLYSANKDVPNAILAFEAAVARDQNYANARYLLALAYAESGRVDDAIAQLNTVRDLNPQNTSVSALITQLQENGSLPPNVAEPDLVGEPTPENEGDSITTTPTTVPESDLLTPVNTPPAEGVSSSETNNTADEPIGEPAANETETDESAQ